MEPIWVDRTTYLKIIELLNRHGEILIEARDFPPIFLKGVVKNECN